MKVSELLTDESKWVKGWSAKDACGLPVNATSCLATCWCLTGAICRCYPDPQDQSEIIGRCYPIVPATKESHTEDVVFWNDAPERTFEDVRKLVTELDI